MLNFLRDAVLLLGAVLIATGVWLIYAPAGLIAAGIFLIVYAVLDGFDETNDNNEGSEDAR